MSHPFRFFFSTVLLSFAFLVALPHTHAQTASPIFVPAALAPTQRDTAIALSALTFDAEILERNGRTIISGNSAFKLHNTDRLNDVQVSVGFPSWAGDPYVFDPGKLENFSVSIDDVKVKTLTPAKAELRIGSTIRTVDWYTFTLSIAGDEKKTVRYEFAQDLGDSAMPRFVYGILPATSWKGSIDSARLTLRLPETTSPEQIIASEPANPEFDGQSITWSWAQKDPASNPALIILRQSTWIDLNNKRRAAQQNPNDVNARVALGALLRQLASMDSPKRDGLSSQAIAELETAVRLDPNHRPARQTLGAVYEARAGAAAGPRNLGYVQLAVAQWQAIASSDANARKQLAEDYFYLGLDAQTRGAFVDASNYFDQASALAPGGAGPLFTTDRLTAQRRALNIAWARTLLDANDATANDKARAALGKFMDTVTPPTFYIERAEITTAAHSRAMAFRLAPTSTSGEIQTTLNNLVAAWRQTGIDAKTSADGTNLVLSVNLSFNASNELIPRLATLSKSLPNSSEWALMRAILSPNSFDWNPIDELLTQTTRYREDIALAPACAAFNAQIDALSKLLTPLENASPKDDEAQLKRTLLQNAQRGWQNAIAFGRVSYRAGTQESVVDACATKTLTWSASAWKIERVGLLIAFAGFIVLVFVAVLWTNFARRRNLKKRQMARQSKPLRYSDSGKDSKTG